MLTFKAPGRALQKRFVASTWGEFIRYVEVAEDQFALRQIDCFKSGQTLHYTRTHWCDVFGRLTGLRFSRKPKWAVFFPGAELITTSEFERVWAGALRSALWEEQVAGSRVAEWGEFRT